jgi:hypothetical protein
MNKTKLITDIHRTNREWLNLISFYQDELTIMEKRIAEVVSKNTDVEVLANAEHFQNQMIIQRNHLLDMQGEIVHLEDKITEEIKNNSIASDHRRHETPVDLSERVSQFRVLFYELRKEFLEYLMRVM